MDAIVFRHINAFIVYFALESHSGNYYYYTTNAGFLYFARAHIPCLPMYFILDFYCIFHAEKHCIRDMCAHYYLFACDSYQPFSPNKAHKCNRTTTTTAAVALKYNSYRLRCECDRKMNSINCFLFCEFKYKIVKCNGSNWVLNEWDEKFVCSIFYKEFSQPAVHISIPFQCTQYAYLILCAFTIYNNKSITHSYLCAQ